MQSAQDIIDEIDAEDFDDMDIKYVNVTNLTDSLDIEDDVSHELENSIHQELTTPLNSKKRKIWAQALIDEVEQEDINEV